MDTMERQRTTTRADRSSLRPDNGGRHTTIAGALLALTGIGIVLSIITNEALYPVQRHYSTFANTISDLGGTIPPNSYLVQPNRGIFIATMAVAGAMILCAALLLRGEFLRRSVVTGLYVFGAALIGLAIFPGNVATWHPWIALVCFVSASVTAIMSRKVLERPVRYFAVVSGVVALAATVAGLEVFGDVGPQAWIGIGGVERWIAYPVLLWLVMFGTVLMTRRGDQRA
jgi:hypothetical membrane protein